MDLFKILINTVFLQISIASMVAKKLQDREQDDGGLMRLAYAFFDIKLRRFLNIPLKEVPFIILYLTKRCNLKCMMCDQWKTDKKTIEKEISTRNWLRVIDAAAKLKPMMIVLGGGEPLARPDIFQIITHLTKRNLRYHLCTNGMLLNKVNLSRLKAYPPSTISVSLDGNNAQVHNELRGVNCFSQVLNGIHLSKEELLTTRIGINFLLCKKNFKNLHRMVPFAKRLGVDRLNLLPINTNLLHRDKSLESFSGLLFLEKDIPELEKELTKFRNAAARWRLKTNSAIFLDRIPRLYDGKRKTNRACPAGYASIGIDSYGRMAPCADMDGISCIRNGKIKDFRTLMASPDYAILRKKVKHCQVNCWDTINGELSIRFSMANIPFSFMNWLKDTKYYIGSAKVSARDSREMKMNRGGWMK